MKLLVVDNDRDLVEELSGWLMTRGYEVHRAYNGERAKIDWEELQPDLVILNTSLKDVDALAMCRDMRQSHDALVLVTTNEQNVQDEIHCLEAGADGYLRKPFIPRQLSARIRAMRRPASSIITAGPLRVDSLHNEVSVDGKIVRLTPTESKLLYLLAVNANNVCTAHQIISSIWGSSNDGDASLIRSHIHHLRRKVEPNPNLPRYILTVPGVGYTLICRSTQRNAKHPRLF
jgi:DNA-binding response OmpR family regulator